MSKIGDARALLDSVSRFVSVSARHLWLKAAADVVLEKLRSTEAEVAEARAALFALGVTEEEAEASDYYGRRTLTEAIEGRRVAQLFVDGKLKEW